MHTYVVFVRGRELLVSCPNLPQVETCMQIHEIPEKNR